MSVNVYVKEEIRELPGFRTTDLGTMKYSPEVGVENTIHKGYYFMWELDDQIPEELRDLVKEISCHMFIPKMAVREAGIYRLGSGECELVPEDRGNRMDYKLRIKANNLEDIRELIHLIKTGAIRPDESYQAPQGGKTRRQLEIELTAAQQLLGEALMEIEGLHATAEQLKAGGERFKEVDGKLFLLSRLATQFRAGRWPLCWKTNAADEIDAIIYGNGKPEFDSECQI